MKPPIVFNSEFLAYAIERALFLGGPPLRRFYAGLFKNQAALGPVMTSGGFVEPTWASYSRQILNYGGPFTQADGSQAAIQSPLAWNNGPDGVGDIIFGFFACLAPGGSWTLGFAGKFDTPLPIIRGGQSFIVPATIVLSSAVRTD